jgi:hypothetical protein
MNFYERMERLDPETFDGLIADTTARRPFLARDHKKPILSILQSLRKSPFFLPAKPTPVVSALQYLNSVLQAPIHRADLVFVLAAIKAPLGVRIAKQRHTFKLFPDGVMPKGYESYAVSDAKRAEKLDYAMSEVLDPTKQERANIQSCTNKLIKQYELKEKAMQIYRLTQEGHSFSQAKKDLALGDREAATAYQYLVTLGLVRPRRVTRRKSVELSPDNLAHFRQLAETKGKTLDEVVNDILDAKRSTKPAGGKH